MSTRTRPDAGHGPFDHRMAVFDTDEEFLKAALPFLTEALAAPDEPSPVAIVAPARLALLRDALDQDPPVTLIPHTDWYTGTAANAISRAAGYLAEHAGPGGRLHLLMEPDWGGRAGSSARESTEWIRYESLANLLFAPLATTALCVYDTRTAGRAVIAEARRAHPDTGVYEDPYRLTAELDAAVPLPPPPGDAQAVPVPEVAAWAGARGLGPADAALLGAAVAEAAAELATPSPAVLAWGTAPACVCELRVPRRVGDPLVGFVPPRGALGPERGQGLWFARQVCAYVDVRDGAGEGQGAGATVRLQYG
ncbi:MEDS domain-containing protein [Streptomyces sp. NPDC088387]|uniref:MEDS domain-containing protein n=1 Tax=Streptomyces sp. NPDC088387 TaxID=3365859 RepID=UPI00382042A8